MPTQLRVIRILQLIFGGILVLPLHAIVLMFIYGLVAGKDWANLDTFTDQQELLKWLLFAAVVLWGAMNIVSALWIGKRKRWTWSIVIAIVNTVLFPLGTLVGLPSLLVLASKGSKEYYAHQDFT